MVLSARLALSLIAALAYALLPEQRGQHEVFHRSANTWLDVWARWDSEYYLDIAQYGYSFRRQLIVFFPFYPLLVAALGGLLREHYLLAGVIVSTGATFVALMYLFKLAAWEFGPEVARRSMLYLALFPTAVFLMAVYSESVFLAVSVAAFYHARRGQWLLAGLFAFLAGVTRPNGFVVAFPLAYEAWRQGGGSLRAPLAGLSWSLFGRLLAAGAAPLGLLLWFGYLGLLTGDPLASLKQVNIPPWSRTSSLPWATLGAAFQNLARADLSRLSRAVSSADLAVVLLLIQASLLAWWRLPRIYAVYLTAATLMLLSSRSVEFPLESAQRYALVIFPLYFLLAQLGGSRLWHRAILICSAPLLGLYTALFATWHWRL